MHQISREKPINIPRNTGGKVNGIGLVTQNGGFECVGRCADREPASRVGAFRYSDWS